MGLSDQPGSFGGSAVGPPSPALNFGPDPAAGIFTSGTGGGNWSSDGGIGASIMGLIQNNPGALLSGGLLASQLFRGNEQYPAEKSLQNLATNTGTQGAALAGYINSGTLPPGAQQAVDAATNAAKAETRSAYGRMGLGDSTMKDQALAEIDQRKAAQTFQFANQLLAQGANYTNISANIYDNLLKTQAGTDQEFQRALMTFAGGLGGLRGGGSTA
jgi:hypothetical protein